MRAVVQRVRSAKVTVDGETVGEIGVGLLVYLGVGGERHGRRPRLARRQDHRPAHL